MSLVPLYKKDDTVFIPDPQARKGKHSNESALVKATVIFTVPTGNSIIYKLRVQNTGKLITVHERLLHDTQIASA